MVWKSLRIITNFLNFIQGRRPSGQTRLFSQPSPRVSMGPISTNQLNQACQAGQKTHAASRQIEEQLRR